MHMVFTGNPGTAKTTVARLFARIFKENGVLSKGDLSSPLHRALATLKDIERTCITLFYLEDQSIEKIAGITGCPTEP